MLEEETAMIIIGQKLFEITYFKLLFKILHFKN